MCVAYEKKCIFQLFVIFTLLLAFCSQKWWGPLYPSSPSQRLKSVFCSQQPSLASNREEIHLHFPKWLASCSSAIFQGAIFCPPPFFHSLFSPSGLCGSTKSPEWSPQKCHVALSLSARDRPERPVTQIPQRPLSCCRRGSGLSRSERAPQL